MFSYCWGDGELDFEIGLPTIIHIFGHILHFRQLTVRLRAGHLCAAVDREGRDPCQHLVRLHARISMHYLFQVCLDVDALLALSLLSRSIQGA